MPRTARTLSSSNIYHCMMRGVNRQNIFEDDEDRYCFMTVLSHCKKLSGFRLYAFALMSNHVHLLVEPAGEPLDTVFRRIDTRYAVWFNRKYERAGHLFQDRFLSENVETDLYFRTVLRYIILNPVKGGLVRHPRDYRWSSYLAYEKNRGTVTDTQYALDLFGGRDTLMEYFAQDNDDYALDEASVDRRLRDERAKEIMLRITGCSTTAAFQQLDPSLRKESIGKLYRAGLSMGQISRFAGVSKSAVFRAVNKQKDQSSEDEELILREEEPTAFDYSADIIW